MAPRLVPFRANLTQFGANCGIRGVKSAHLLGRYDLLRSATPFKGLHVYLTMNPKLTLLSLLRFKFIVNNFLFELAN